PPAKTAPVQVPQARSQAEAAQQGQQGQQALAQTAVSQGTLTGTVSDPAGGVVASATIEAKNVDTGTLFQGVSTATGNFTIGQLPPGAYEVSAAVPGFKKYVQQGLA